MCLNSLSCYRKLLSLKKGVEETWIYSQVGQKWGYPGSHYLRLVSEMGGSLEGLGP